MDKKAAFFTILGIGLLLAAPSAGALWASASATTWCYHWGGVEWRANGYATGEAGGDLTDVGGSWSASAYASVATPPALSDGGAWPLKLTASASVSGSHVLVAPGTVLFASATGDASAPNRLPVHAEDTSSDVCTL